jgi:hypothetical protein
LLECRGVEFEEVEKITIEADGQIVIVLNLAGMTELNLVDDSSKMGDAFPLDFRTALVLRAHGAALRIALALHPGKTVSYCA